MKSHKYYVGKKLIFREVNIVGEVVDPLDDRFTKRPVMPDDICVIWSSGDQSTYDADFLDKWTEARGQAE